MDATERATASSEIQAILHKYAYMARENAKFDEMASLWTPDGIFRLPNGVAVKATEISKVVKGQEPTFIRHHLTTTTIDFVTPHEAKTVAYYFACTHKSSMDHWGYWQDVFEKGSDGAWLIKDRSVMVDGSDPKGWFAEMYGSNS